MLMFLIESLIISITKSQESCNVSSNLEIFSLKGINVIASLQSCLGNIDGCQNGIKLNRTGRPISISKSNLTLKILKF